MNCIIRIVVKEVTKNGRRAGVEAIYLRLVEINGDGTLVGVVEDTYRFTDTSCGNDLKTGDRVTVTRDQINEIPLEGWQPDEYLEAVKHLEPAKVGYGITGVRDA